jgi:hypothetical protein
MLVEATGVPRENHRPASSHWQTLWHSFESSTPRLSGFRTHNVSFDRQWLHNITNMFWWIAYLGYICFIGILYIKVCDKVVIKLLTTYRCSPLTRVST